MAVRDEDLTLVATVQAEAADLGSASTTLLERMIAAASDAIRGYIGRPLHRATVTESYAGHGDQWLSLGRLPVISVASVSWNGSELDADSYTLDDPDAGLLYRACGWPYTGRMLRGMLQEDRAPGSEQRLLEVTYTAGWLTPQQGDRTLPFDLEQACIETVVSLYRRKGRAGDIAGESIGIASVTYRNPNSVIGVGGGGMLPDAVLPTLNRYRSPR